MAGVNKVILIGNIGKDPESRTMQNGGKVVSFSLATSETWNDKASGERREKVQWHRVVIFNDRIADVAEKYLKKGSKAYVEGALESRKYTDKDGIEREITEVVLKAYRGELTLLGDPGGNGAGEQRGGGGYDRGGYDRGGSQPRGDGANTGRRPHTASSWEPGPDVDDEIPF